jgi:RHS repeat-associated protein
VLLSPGTYTLRASDEFSGGFVSVSVGFQTYGPVSKKSGGGLRLAELRSADAMGNIVIRKYRYTLRSDTSRSSGVVSAEPAYSFQYTSSACSYFSISSTSKMPLGDGPPVGYSDVQVLEGSTGQFGSTRHTFTTALNADDQSVSSSVWPFSTRTSYEWKRGLATGERQWDASGRLQRRDTSTFAFRDAGAPDTATTRRFRGLSIHSFSAGELGSVYLSNAFEIISAWEYKDSETTFAFDTSGTSSFSTTKSFAYENPKHLQLTELTETNSDGTQRITRMRYAADYATGEGNAEASALTQMQGALNMHAQPIERWVIKRAGGVDSVVSAELTSFKRFPTGQVLPFQRFVLSNPTGVTNFAPASVSSGSFVKDSRYLVQETANNYDAYGRLTQLADARGTLTNYQYGGNANSAFLTQVNRVHDATGSVDLVTNLAYDGDGNLQSIQDDGGAYRYFTYDLFGRLRQVKNTAGTPVKAYGYTYSRTSPSWTFNAASPNAVIDSTFLQYSPSVKAVVSTQYLDGLGRPIQSVVQNGTSYVVAATQYDAMGRAWRQWKPYTRASAGFDPSFATNATSFYNSYLGQSLAKPYVETLYRPEPASRVSKIFPEYVGSAPSIAVQHAYGIDAALKQTIAELTDESGKKRRSLADVFGNEVKTILGYGAPEATTTQFTVDILGHRVKTTDPRSLVTSYALDTRGLLASRVNPDAGTASFKYDHAGNARYSQDAKQAAAGTVAFTTYDFAGRPLVSGEGPATFASLDPDAGSPPALETTQGNWRVVRQYDAKPSTAAFPWSRFSAQIAGLSLANVSGRLAAVASYSNGAWQATLFSYDADGRIATRYTYTEAMGGGSVLTALNTTVQYVRDLRDALTERRLTVGATAFNHWYDYDGRGLLWKVFASTGSTKPATADVTFSYRPSGELQDRQFAGGPLVPLRYTIREQLEKIGDPALTSYPFSARYAYNANGTVSEAEFYSAGTPAAAKRVKYAFPTYDALNRLKSADFSTWTGSSWAATLAHDLPSIGYDAAGNLTTLRRYRETGTLVDNLTYSYTAGTNRLASVSDAVGATAESWDAESGSFSYDANGNLLTAPAPYSLSAVTYDERNLPLAVTRAGVTTSYRYDEAGQRIAKRVGSGNTEVYVLEGATPLGVVTVDGAGTPVSWYFTVLAGAKPVGRAPNAGSRVYYHADLLGSTRAVVSGASVVESYDYDPYGVLLPGRTLGSGTKEGFTGKERDAETGMDYFGARYYLAALGRWDSVDPLGEKHPEWSPYNYVLGNPMVLVDPDGMQTWAQAKEFGAGFASGAWSGVKGTAAGITQTVLHPIQTVSGVVELATNSEARAAAVTALKGAVEERIEMVTSGDACSTGQVIGEVSEVVGEVLVGAAVAKGARAASVASELEGAAGRAVAAVGEGRGAAYGTRVHTAFQKEVEALGRGNLATEVSLKNGRPVSRGTPGSVRLDVVQYGRGGKIKRVYDLKTGTAKLTDGRIEQIQTHVGHPIPVTEIRP